MTHQIVHERISKKGNKFLAGRNKLPEPDRYNSKYLTGWWLFAQSLPSDKFKFMYYTHRSDKWNWGDLDIRPIKNGTFRVIIDESRGGKRYKWAKVVNTFREAKSILNNLMRLHYWQYEGTSKPPEDIILFPSHETSLIPRYQWERARRLKIYHPFMGKMSFPDDINRPSRVVTATESPATREAIILGVYKDDKLIGFRSPTVREAASIMGFGSDYQFLGGSESANYKLVGNSVAPPVSRALADAILEAEGMK